MKHDIHKLGSRLEKFRQEGVAIERKILEWKLAEEKVVKQRSGASTQERFLFEAESLRVEAESAAAASDLPEAVDVQAISRLLAEVHLAAWGV